jgi:uncharacterized RDD family membrane protein YckC
MEQNTNMYGYYAGFVSRLFAFVTDVIVIVVVITLITWLVTFLNFVLPFETLVNEDVLSVILTAVFTTGVAIGYPLLFWTLTGQTPGKMLMGLRVVTTDGNYLSLRQSVLRYFGYFIAALPLYLGFLWILVDDRRQGWQDKIAGTCVVYTWNARPDETFFRKLLGS